MPDSRLPSAAPGGSPSPHHGAAPDPTGSGSTDPVPLNGGRKPSGGWFELVRFLSDPLTYLPRLAERHGGDLVPFRLGRLPCTLVTHPELIRDGLVNESWPPISRGRLMNIANWFTEGLFVSEGEEHHRQRDEIWKPILEDPSIPRVAVEVAEEWSGAWTEGQVIDAFAELRALDYTIDWKAMTGEDLRENPALLSAFETGADTLPWLILPLGRTRWSLPLPDTLRAKRAKRRIDEVVSERIEERRSGRSDGDDLLATMVRARDAEGSMTTDEQLRSTVKMYFGADQLHALFAWTLHLLSEHQDVEARLHGELDRVLGGGDISPEDARRLPYLRNVIKESMRIMPPVWGFFRELTGDFRLGDTLLPQGSLMAFSPWVTHRDPRYWNEPLVFDPDRWEAETTRPAGLTYFPFSAGPYWCHGGNLAMQEGLLILAVICRRWTLRATDSGPVKPIATWCTEPRGGLPLRLERRS